jgi:hypothetical protein
MTGKPVQGPIEDPKFNCYDYNLGYLNRGVVSAWFYRIPAKQWKQGLKNDQIAVKASCQDFYNIDFKSSQDLARMLENNYPNFETCVKSLKSMNTRILAFHKNFAMTFDDIHDDFIFEYKGDKIGYSNNLKDFKFIKQYEHLEESLKEAIGQ